MTSTTTTIAVANEAEPERTISTTNATITLAMIVKNESKIITRMLDSIATIIDAACIVDTGSTDNTEEVLTKWFEEHKIPFHLAREPFRDFGYNRTHSVKEAKKAFPLSTYLLFSDADFVWKVNSRFNKNLLYFEKIYVNQRDPTMTWGNIRMMRASLPIECIGVTHEYWDVEEGYKGPMRQYTLSTLTIEDISDGGSRHDKFPRDERLLSTAIAELEAKKTPLTEREAFLHSRYLFYLARTYEFMYQYEKAIEIYKRRYAFSGIVSIGDTYYSAYSIGNCYLCLLYKLLDYASGDIIDGNPEALTLYNNALEWLTVTQERWPQRAEALLKKTEVYRRYCKHQEAYDCAQLGLKVPLPVHENLFVDHLTYKYKFHQELSIVCYWLHDKTKDKKYLDEGIRAGTTALACPEILEHDRRHIQGNLQHYI